jgi:hypothetical protein
MGQVLAWSRRVDLAAMTPRPDLASTQYCLAQPNVEYLVFLPNGSKSVTLKLPAGQFRSTWFHPATGKEQKPQPLMHSGNERSLQSPFTGDTLLHLQRVE